MNSSPGSGQNPFAGGVVELGAPAGSSNEILRIAHTVAVLPGRHEILLLRLDCLFRIRFTDKCGPNGIHVKNVNAKKRKGEGV
jgi:hypothetical protein